MYYHDAVDWLFKRLPMYQRIGKAAYKTDLTNSLLLDEMTGHPHKSYKVIHIAGTNGKGSVAHMLASVLQHAGYRTGLFTSPHMVDYRERIKINGNLIEEQYVAEFITAFKEQAEAIEPSFFELTNAMAFKYFADHNVDIAVVETGLGGRLDSTNIVDPVLSIITNIGLDHQEYLGNTLREIAREKAGIIKPCRDVVIGELQESIKDIFIDIASKNNSPVLFADTVVKIIPREGTHHGQRFTVVRRDNKETYELQVDLAGLYQCKNLVTVLASLEKLCEQGLKISRSNIVAGLATVKATTNFRGRWQVISNKPLVVCDTGHNYSAFGYILKQLADLRARSIHFVLGFVNDKDIDPILSLLPKDGRYYLTKANVPRALDEQILLDKCLKLGLNAQSYKLVEVAYKSAIKNAHQEDIIFIGGSTFVVAEVF